jgi:diguanylate cyclase (GGDEF)-like protein/PAS domain S-box-containing protein
LFDSNLAVTVSVLDRDFRFRYVNSGFAMAFNLTPQAMLGKSVHDIYGDVQYPAILPYLERALAGEALTYERKGRMRQTEDVWRSVSMTPWRDADGTVVGIVTASLAVHELKASTEALRAANERLSSHMDNSPLTVLELDAALNITRVSSRVTQMLGLEPERLTGQPLLQALGPGPHQEPLQTAFARLQAGAEARNRVESTHVGLHGARVHCQWFNSALTNAQGQVTSIMALVEDVSARVLAQEQLRHVAQHDSLTGLPNRSGLAERLASSLARAHRTGEPVALLFIDLDGFKAVNDEFGHASGDEVLCEITRRLTLAVRETDVVARYGGDEFVVLLDTEVQAGTPDVVGDRVFAALAIPCAFSNGQAVIGASIGAAMHPPLPNDANDLIKHADAAMYAAKQAGKGCMRHAGSQELRQRPSNFGPRRS